jgi:hypothetical protein
MLRESVLALTPEGSTLISRDGTNLCRFSFCAAATALENPLSCSNLPRKDSKPIERALVRCFRAALIGGIRSAGETREDARDDLAKGVLAFRVCLRKGGRQSVRSGKGKFIKRRYSRVSTRTRESL